MCECYKKRRSDRLKCENSKNNNSEMTIRDVNMGSSSYSSSYASSIDNNKNNSSNSNSGSSNSKQTTCPWANNNLWRGKEV